MNFQNDLILRAAKGEQVERVPVWMMRQAGRVLTEYKAVRSTFPDFKAFIKHPEASAEVTIQPVDIFGVDAAIVFSDILTVPEAMGCDYNMVESRGPVFPNPIQSAADIERMRSGDLRDELSYVGRAVEESVKGLNGRVPVIGFSGAPWTIFAYMTEGSGSKTFSKAKKWLYTEPSLSHSLLQKITDTTIHYLHLQVDAGASMVQVFDSWAGSLSAEQYQIFGAFYMKQIADSLSKRVPVTLFAKGAHQAIGTFSESSCNTIGVDWNTTAAEARMMSGDKVLQGNADPCLLYAKPEEIFAEVEKMIAGFGKQRYIANLGHGLYPDTPRENAHAFVEAVKTLGRV